MRSAVLGIACTAFALLAGGCSSSSSSSEDPLRHTDASTDGPSPVDGGPGAGEDAREDGPSEASPTDAASPADAPADASPPSADASDGAVVCIVDLVAGDCTTVTACAALGGHTSTPGLCPGPASVECCTLTPDVSTNPPVPSGWMLMAQAMVTPAMTTWAVMILNDPIGYPMFSTTMMTFGTQLVMARVEWHPPDFQNSKVHRGVTLYVPV